MSPSHQVHWTLTKMCPEQWPFHGHHLQMRSVMTGSTTWWPNGTRSKEHGTPLEIAFSTTGSLSATSCQVVNTSSGSMPRTTWAAPNQWNHQNGWLLPKKVGTEDEGRVKGLRWWEREVLFSKFCHLQITFLKMLLFLNFSFVSWVIRLCEGYSGPIPSGTWEIRHWFILINWLIMINPYASTDRILRLWCVSEIKPFHKVCK